MFKLTLSINIFYLKIILFLILIIYYNILLFFILNFKIKYK